MLPSRRATSPGRSPTRSGARRAACAARASFDDVLRLTFYVTGWAPEKIGPFMAGVEEVAGEIGLRVPLPPSSLIGVDHLFEPDVLVEVEATAILD